MVITLMLLDRVVKIVQFALKMVNLLNINDIDVDPIFSFFKNLSMLNFPECIKTL